MIPPQMVVMPNKAGKRRPGTAGRKAQVSFGKKMGLGVQHGSGNIVGAHVPNTVKASSQIDLEVSKLRPRVIH